MTHSSQPTGNVPAPQVQFPTGSLPTTPPTFIPQPGYIPPQQPYPPGYLPSPRPVSLAKSSWDNALAIVGFVLGLLSLLGPFIAGVRWQDLSGGGGTDITALIRAVLIQGGLGVLSAVISGRSLSRQSHKGLAIVGLIASCISLLAAFLLGFLVFAFITIG